MARRHSDEIRRKAIAELARGFKPRTVAQRHHVHVSTIYYWRSQQTARSRRSRAPGPAFNMRSVLYQVDDITYRRGVQKAVAKLDGIIARSEKRLEALRGARDLLTRGTF